MSPIFSFLAAAPCASSNSKHTVPLANVKETMSKPYAIQVSPQLGTCSFLWSGERAQLSDIFHLFRCPRSTGFLFWMWFQSIPLPFANHHSLFSLPQWRQRVGYEPIILTVSFPPVPAGHTGECTFSKCSGRVCTPPRIWLSVDVSVQKSWQACYILAFGGSCTV